MKLKKAIKILEQHNEWRKGSETIPMTEPKKLTKAIETILAYLNQF
jgi:hypothetical protein